MMQAIRQEKRSTQQALFDWALDEKVRWLCVRHGYSFYKVSCEIGHTKNWLKGLLDEHRPLGIVALHDIFTVVDTKFQRSRVTDILCLPRVRGGCTSVENHPDSIVFRKRLVYNTSAHMPLNTVMNKLLAGFNVADLCVLAHIAPSELSNLRHGRRDLHAWKMSLLLDQVFSHVILPGEDIIEANTRRYLAYKYFYDWLFSLEHKVGRF
jgi:hypothetical protein